MSDTRTIDRLLVAYTLCQDSIEAHRLLTEHIKDALFFMGMIAYYSVMDTNSQARRDLENDLLNPSKGFTIYLRADILDSQQRGLGAALWDIFRKNKRIRNAYIAHNRSKGSIPREPMLVRLPEVVGGEGLPNKYPYGSYVRVDDFPHLEVEEKQQFVALVGASIDLRWQRGDKPTPYRPNNKSCD